MISFSLGKKTSAKFLSAFPPVSASRTCCSRQSSIEHNSSQDQAQNDCCQQQQPSPVLGWMAQNADEMSAIVVGDDSDECVTGTSTNSHHGQKPHGAVVRSARSREKQACGRWKRYRCRDGQSAGTPSCEKLENGIDLPISKLAVQVRQSRRSCNSEREVCSDNRSCCCHRCIFIPRIVVAGSEYCRQDVGASKCW